MKRCPIREALVGEEEFDTSQETRFDARFSISKNTGSVPRRDELDLMSI